MALILHRTCKALSPLSYSKTTLGDGQTPFPQDWTTLTSLGLFELPELPAFTRPVIGVSLVSDCDSSTGHWSGYEAMPHTPHSAQGST